MNNSHQSFEALWHQIQRTTIVSHAIKNWTKDKGYFGGDLIIHRVDSQFVEFDSPNAKNYQRVYKNEFATVYEVWDDYIAGRVKRHQIRDVTRFSKYIISLLHHVLSKS